MLSKITPLYDQIFIVKEEADKTASGLHLPETVKGRAVVGRAIAVGPGLLSPYTGTYLTMQVKAGDKVFLREFSGYIVRYGGEECHVMKEQDIIGIINDEEE